MLFNSIAFAIFFPTLLIIYWFFFNKNTNAQNLLLLAGSYFFYGWWDYRFLTLLFLLSSSSYFIAILITNSKKSSLRKIFFISGLVIDLGVLIVFKYANFFIENFVILFESFGLRTSVTSLNIILPLGISFYTFLALSYIIDVYRNQFPAEKNFVNVFLSISFFPILLAGPIERPSSLIPQLKSDRKFDPAIAEKGLAHILWGLFMKIAIADNCAVFADKTFSGFYDMKGIDVLLGVFFFVVQIYSDFAGYSHIAIGIGKLMGIRIMKNFNYPYFSGDIKEFWKKWNISLTNWFRDYVFLPVAYAMSKRIKDDHFFMLKTDTAIYITGSVCTWLLTGLWHGASFSFILWGILQGFFLIVYHLSFKPRKRTLKNIGLSNRSLLIRVPEYLFTLIIIFISFTFFRADHISDVGGIINKIFSRSLMTAPNLKIEGLLSLFLITLFFTVEWYGRKYDNPIQSIIDKIPQKAAWIFYYLLIMMIFLFGGKQQQFIYLQF
jgi:alginate O-acetyltransferase complex protein AlgI